MARPRTAVETAGRVTLTAQRRDPETRRWVTAQSGVRPERWRARTKYRDSDGELRDVEKFAPTKTKAEAALKAALRERQAHVAAGELRPETTVEDATAYWLRQVERDSTRAVRTKAHYRGSVTRYVTGSSIAKLTLREVNRVAVLERYLQVVADERGTGSAKTARSVLSNVLGLAVRYGVLPYNAMRDTKSARASNPQQVERNTSRALTLAERTEVLRVAEESERAQALDVTDLIHFLAGTGARISEALAVEWDDVELGAGTVRIRGTKSKAADRVLSMPLWLTDRLTDRGVARGATGLLFASPGTQDRAKVRDLRNVSRVIRQVLDEAGCPWATSHTFRRTVATMLGDGGAPLRTLADQLGHADPSMTARAYLGRRSDLSAAAALL